MRCGIVIPVYKAYQSLDKYELVSLKQVVKILGKYSFALVYPKNMDVSGYIQYFSSYSVEIRYLPFRNMFFDSVISYSRLMLSRSFYKHFTDFNYILIYQADSFVFEDKIEEWCKKDYSYVGAPWFEDFSGAKDEAKLVAVGNGGFSLRKVSHFIKALNSFSLINSWGYVIRAQLSKNKYSFLRNVAVIARRLLFGNNSFGILNDFYRYNNNLDNFQEDYFWGVICRRNFPWFKVPDPMVALAFSFEVRPEKMFSYNNFKLPVGAHAWYKYNLEFWKPYLAEHGYEM